MVSAGYRLELTHFKQRLRHLRHTFGLLAQQAQKIRRFRQQTPPAQSTYIPQPPPDEPPRTRYQVPLLTVRSQFFSCDLVPPPRRLI